MNKILRVMKWPKGTSQRVNDKRITSLKNVAKFISIYSSVTEQHYSPQHFFSSPSGGSNCILSASCNGYSIIFHKQLLHYPTAEDPGNTPKFRMLFTWCLSIQPSNYAFSKFNPQMNLSSLRPTRGLEETFKRWLEMTNNTSFFTEKYCMNY